MRCSALGLALLVGLGLSGVSSLSGARGRPARRLRMHGGQLQDARRSLKSVAIALAIGVGPLCGTHPAWAAGGSDFATSNGNVAEVAAVVASSRTAEPQAPSEDDIREVQEAFQAFDTKQLKRAELLFSTGIATWVELRRPRDEIVALIMARGNVLVDLKRFPEALRDYDAAIALMEPDGMVAETGRARYREFPNAFVQRGLAFEGLGDWTRAVAEYGQAITMWGGGRGDGINPFVLTYRGNALTQLGDYQGAAEDYEAASNLFLGLKDKRNAAEARANLALALYESGDQDGAVKMIKLLLRKGGMADERQADMHVALASHYASQDDKAAADAEFNTACYDTKAGCRDYYDFEYLRRIRRWPPSLIEPLRTYLGRSKAQEP